MQVQVTAASEVQSILNSWKEKTLLASHYLDEAQEFFIQGDELSGCITQEKAAKIGIEATNSLIMELKANNSTDGIDYLEEGINKWRELRDAC